MKVLVTYYSMFGHMYQMAQAVSEGIKSVPGAELVLRRVQELEEVKRAMENHPQMGAGYKAVQEMQKHIPVCTLDDLREADGLVLGSPTRYGNMTAQVKQLIDSTGQLWLKGELEGKPAGLFTSTGSMHWGQESTLLSMMVPLLHLGMIIVGVPASVQGALHTEARGATPYGASTVAGPVGQLQPVKEDLEIAKALGKRVAEVTLRLRAK